MRDELHVVTLGGGTGHYALLRALKLLPRVSLTAVVSVADSGGSSGVLRDRHGMLPPGDILKAILALTESDPDFVRELLLHRFDQQRFAGHTIGNLLIAMHIQQTGDSMSAIRALSQLLCVNHAVVPVTFGQIHISARYSDGEYRYGEDAIDTYRGDAMIEELMIEPETAQISHPAREALMLADAIIIAPGSVHTSLLPVLKVGGVSRLLRQSLAPKIFVCNTMTLNGDTRGFCVQDFIRAIESACGCPLDRVLVDVSAHDVDVLARYACQKQFPVRLTDACRADRRVFGAEIVATDGELVRHDYEKLASALRQLLDDACFGSARTHMNVIRPVGECV